MHKISKFNIIRYISISITSGNIAQFEYLFKTHHKALTSVTINNFMHRACEFNNIKVIKMMIEQFKVDTTTNRSRLYLNSAVKFYREDIVEYLLTDPRIDPSIYNNVALRFAASSEHRTIIKMLMSHPKVMAKLNYVCRDTSVMDKIATRAIKTELVHNKKFDYINSIKDADIFIEML